MAKELKRTIYKKLGFTGLETARIVNNLNKLLANYQVHLQKMKNFYWNVKGDQFFQFRQLFNELKTFADTNIDLIAERIRIFGQAPESKLDFYLKISDIKEADENLQSEIMIRETISDFQALLSYMVDTADAALDIGDIGTQNMIDSFITEMEKYHWKLNACLQGKQIIL